ncbi:MAG TPA: hypothetical protein VNZ49_15395, partial [Bacteroidia bacterium]|nr:hypothetical protein [Bacteroidia bacterium]
MKKVLCFTERLVLCGYITLLVIANPFRFSANLQTGFKAIAGITKSNDVPGKKLKVELLSPQPETPINKIKQVFKLKTKNENGVINRGGLNQASALTLRTWTGATNNTFNTATNWNPNGIPSSTDSCVIVLATNKTISLNAASTIGALYVSLSGSNNVLRVDAVSNALTINGTTTLKATGGNGNTQLQINVGNGGSVTYGGSLTCTGFSANQGIIFPVLGAGGTTGTVTFKGDVTYANAVASSSTNLPGTAIFDANGTQTINNISSLYINYLPSTVLFGSTNTPTVTITGQQGTWFPLNNVTVKANSKLILPGGATSQDGGTLNNASGAGTLTLNSGSILQIGADQGDWGLATGSLNGVAGSNFPGVYSSYSFNAASIVEYNSNNGVNQTVYNPPIYGHLTLTNGNGTGATTKTAGGNLTMNGNVTINTLATFDASAFSHSLQGNWINAGTFTANTSTVTFNGTPAQSISGASITTFNSLTINNTSGTGVTLSQAINAGGTLTMSSGHLFTTSANILTLTSSAISTAGTSASTSYVDGPMIIQKNTAGSTMLNFPI